MNFACSAESARLLRLPGPPAPQPGWRDGERGSADWRKEEPCTSRSSSLRELERGQKKLPRNGCKTKRKWLHILGQRNVDNNGEQA